VDDFVDWIGMLGMRRGESVQGTTVVIGAIQGSFFAAFGKGVAITTLHSDSAVASGLTGYAVPLEYAREAQTVCLGG
jgi:hypothetical protein